jgi:hypothetical protein
MEVRVGSLQTRREGAAQQRQTLVELSMHACLLPDIAG